MMSDRKITRTLFRYFDFCVEACLFVIVIAMLAAGIAQVLARYVFQASLSWSEEFMRFSYVWMTLIGTSLAIRRKQFTSIEAIANLLKQRFPVSQKFFWLATIALQIFFFVLLTRYGMQLVTRNLHQVSPAMGVSMGLAYCALPAGGVLGVLYSGISIWDELRGGEKS